MGVISDEIEDDDADAPWSYTSGPHSQRDPFLANYDLSDWKIVDRAVTLAAAVSLIKNQ
jgi:hypothetical protein